MRHEPKLMAPGLTHYYNGRSFRDLICTECRIVGGESGAGCNAEPTRLCYGFDDDTGKPCGPLPPDRPEADTPLILEAKE